MYKYTSAPSITKFLKGDACLQINNLMKNECVINADWDTDSTKTSSSHWRIYLAIGGVVGFIVLISCVTVAVRANSRNRSYRGTTGGAMRKYR